MKLIEAINRIETGDVLLFEGRAWYSRLVKRWTKSRFSHAGLALWVNIGTSRKLAVVEAQDWAGVRIYPLERRLMDAKKTGEKIHWYALTDPVVNRQRAGEMAVSWWGARYATWTQFLFSFARWTRPVWKWLGWWGRDTDPDRWFCSELVASSLFFAGYIPGPGDESKPWKIPPEGVALFTCLHRRGVLEP